MTSWCGPPVRGLRCLETGNTHSRADEGFGLSVEQIRDVHHNANYRVQQCSLIPIQEPPHSAGVVLYKNRHRQLLLRVMTA